MNILDIGKDLVYLDYSDLLQKILHTLHKQQIFKISDDRNRLRIDIDTVANQVAALEVENPLGASSNSVRSATINISPGSQERFHKQIQEIRDSVKQSLQSVLGNSSSIQEFVTNLVTDLENFKGEKHDLGFTYPFKPFENLQKQRLTFNNKTAGSREILKFHKLTIAVQNIHAFKTQLEQGLENYINVNFSGATAEQREDLSYVLEDLENDEKSDLYELQKIVDKETLGKLKKQAQINYLEFLLENINTDTSQRNSEGAIYLQDFIRRLKLIEEYINSTTKADGDFLVNYGKAQINYRDSFARGEAFNILPIIPIIEGYLGEIKNETQGQIQFVFGVKLKLDGKAQAHGGRNSFQHHLNLLDPDSKEHKEELANESRRELFARRVLNIAFLYFFLFASRNNPERENYNLNAELEYDPIAGFEKNILPILKNSDDAEKKELFRKIVKGFKTYKVQTKINRIKESLDNLLKRKMTFPTREYPLHISVKNGIVEDNLEKIFTRHTFFKQVLRANSKEVLKYISIGEAKAQTSTLCTLSAKITISDIHFFTTEDRETFSMEYDIKGIRTLPLLFAPLNDLGNGYRAIYDQNFSDRKLILFLYSQKGNNLEPPQAFTYRFTFCLLAYICLWVLLEKQSWLFIPILRLHLHKKQDNAPLEKFIASLSGVLSHLLNEKHRSNAQGIDIRDFSSKGRILKLPNTLSSLYSVLPKKFRFQNSSYYPELDKLAIVIVSSRESDSKWSGSKKISNLMGEIVGLQLQDSAVRIQLIKTFSENYDNQRMFTYPSVVIEGVAKLYKKGYRHFVYIAKAPYTSTLHMTQGEDNDGLFFMSKEVIKALKAEHNDIKLYPIFFDKYYAIKLEKVDVSLYIQDTIELTNLVEDPSKQSLVFFNLFNGVSVPGEEKKYNGVISYATLLNIYKGILDDEDIRKGLMYEGPLKSNILQYLTLFHFSRYQKSDRIIHLKLDPYENLIGDDSVGKLSLLNHMKGKGEFNSLAFLTYVRNVLNVAQS
ncbi:hypothetical protein NUACC21_42710 [Scytonema sp. NUACC21]